VGGFVFAVGTGPLEDFSAPPDSRQHELGLPNENMELKAH